MPDRPIDKQPHLAEPNYYRLVYQVAAQRMHAYLTTVSDESSENGERDADPVHSIDRATGAGTNEASTLLKAAGIDADRLIKDANSMQAWFRKRAEQRWWVRGRRLRSGERRLEKFLSATVLPSTKLLKAGIMVVAGERSEAERLVQPIRDKVLQDADLSYRTAYNLACYEVAAAAPNKSGGEARGIVEQQELDTAHLDAALKALREALSGVHGRRRLDLARWAQKDPAMKALSQCSQTRKPTQPSQPVPSQPKKRTYAERFSKLLSDYAPEPVAPRANAMAGSNIPPPPETSSGTPQAEEGSQAAGAN